MRFKETPGAEIGGLKELSGCAVNCSFVETPEAEKGGLTFSGSVIYNTLSMTLLYKKVRMKQLRW